MQCTQIIKALLQIVWMNFGRLGAKNLLLQGFAGFYEVRKLGINWRWEDLGGWWNCTASPHFVRGRQYVVYSETPMSVSCGLNGGEKNSVSLGARPFGRRRQNLP